MRSIKIAEIPLIGVFKFAEPLLTLVERKTRYVALVHLKDDTADVTTKGFGTILQRFAANCRKSLTYDQG